MGKQKYFLFFFPIDFGTNSGTNSERSLIYLIMMHEGVARAILVVMVQAVHLVSVENFRNAKN